MNYYRDKDLDMLDSLTTLASSEAYLKTLLYDRNIVMVHSIDSLVKTGSLFAAVGAAHLPGKRGIIEMLRARGYTVKPVKDSYTDAGKASKEKIEGYFIKPTFTKYTTADGIIALPLFNGSVIENLQNVQSPDLANGGYINIKRLLLKDFLAKNNKAFNPATLDSLFYENIPGRILDKKTYAQDGYTIYDIKNITKTGNGQHYRYYISPLEIIAVSMAGEKNYVRQFEGEVFGNIIIKPIVSSWTDFSPKKGGFSVQLPAYRAVYGENEKAKIIQDAALYAYDPTDKSDYFLLERTLQDNETLEDTDFELKRIHYEFYNQLGIDSTQTKLYTNPAAFTSSSKIGSRPIRLKTVIKGPKYYLLGIVGATEGNSTKFFNSFAIKPGIAVTDYRVYKDTVAHYSVTVPKAANEKLDYEVSRDYRDAFNDSDETEDIFKEKYGTRQFTLTTGQQAGVFYHQYHRYHAVQSVDSLWADLKKFITEDDSRADNDDNPGSQYDDAIEAVAYRDGPEDYSGGRNENSLWNKTINNKKHKITLINEKKEHITNGNYDSYEALAVADNSTQAFKFKAVYRNGTSYLINALVDKDYKGDDPSLEKLFSSFTLPDSSRAETLPDDRLQLFIDDANSEHDSIRSSALAGINQLEITKKNRAKLQQFIESFDFKAEETGSLIQLYGKLGKLKDEAVIPFFDKQYKREGSNTIIQFAVLEALTEFSSQAAYKKIKELLEYDLPISDNSYEIAGLFRSFGYDTENSALLFPDVLQYYSIPEYHEPLVAFTARLLEDEAIKPKKLKSYKKMLLTNTRLEIKRARSRKANNETGAGNDYENEDSNTGNLENYMELLYPFKNDKDVAAVFESIKKLDQKDTNLELAKLNISSGTIDKTGLNALLTDPETLFDVMNILIAEKQNALLKNVTDEQIAASALMSLTSFNTKTDSLVFSEKRIVKYNDNSVSFYFYKIKKTGDTEYSYARKSTERLAAVAFINDGDRINPMAFKNAGQKRLTDPDKLEDYKKAMIDATLNAGKPRASFGNKATGFDIGEYDEDYGDGEPEY